MLEFIDIKKHYRTGLFTRTFKKAVDGVDLRMDKGAIHGLTGRSGCGKSTLAMVTLRLMPATSGRVLIDGKDILKMPASEFNRLRPKYQMIWQSPDTSLNPRMKIGDCILEPLRYHGGIRKAESREVLEKYCDMVELPLELTYRYPHEISGGECQRAVIARILTMEPELIIADEPTSALDILVRKRILDLLKSIWKRLNITMLFISHELEIIRYMCDEVSVMRDGRIVESGPVESVLSAPAHDYTKALVNSSLEDWRFKPE